MPTPNWKPPTPAKCWLCGENAKAKHPFLNIRLCKDHNKHNQDRELAIILGAEYAKEVTDRIKAMGDRGAEIDLVELGEMIALNLAPEHYAG